MTDRYAVDPSTTEDRTVAWICYGLYLFGITNGLTVIIGLIVAYAHIGRAGPVLQTHFDFLIRTVWISIGWLLIAAGLGIVAFILTLTIIGIPLAVLLGLVAWAIVSLGGVWFVVRMIVGMVVLSRGEPYPRPKAWLF